MSKIHPSHQLKYMSVQPPTLKISLESIYDLPHHTLYTKCRFFYDSYKYIINFIIVLLIISIIILISVLSNKISSDNPCSEYDSEDYASMISKECFNYLWLKVCKVSIPNDFDGGWWLRSPNGNRMVSCGSSNEVSSCGAGSYKTITTYLYTCNLYFKGN